MLNLSQIGLLMQLNQADMAPTQPDGSINLTQLTLPGHIGSLGAITRF